MKLTTREFMHSAKGCKAWKNTANEAEGASKGKTASKTAPGSAKGAHTMQPARHADFSAASFSSLSWANCACLASSSALSSFPLLTLPEDSERSSVSLLCVQWERSQRAGQGVPFCSFLSAACLTGNHHINFMPPQTGLHVPHTSNVC